MQVSHHLLNAVTGEEITPQELMQTLFTLSRSRRLYTKKILSADKRKAKRKVARASRKANRK